MFRLFLSSKTCILTRLSWSFDSRSWASRFSFSQAKRKPAVSRLFSWCCMSTLSIATLSSELSREWTCLSRVKICSWQCSISCLVACRVSANSATVVEIVNSSWLFFFDKVWTCSFKRTSSLFDSLSWASNSSFSVVTRSSIFMHSLFSDSIALHSARSSTFSANFSSSIVFNAASASTVALRACSSSRRIPSRSASMKVTWSLHRTSSSFDSLSWTFNSSFAVITHSNFSLHSLFSDSASTVALRACSSSRKTPSRSASINEICSLHRTNSSFDSS